MLYHPHREWTLASFTPRRNSQHARAAGIRFVAQERPTIATLVLAGPPGSGKTHLLHALAQHARRNHAINQLACLSATQWAQEVAAGLHFSDIRQVMHHFAQQDLLALDDADRLWGLPQAQHAFSELLQERQARSRRTLLTATLYPATPHNPQPTTAMRSAGRAGGGAFVVSPEFASCQCVFRCAASNHLPSCHRPSTK